MKPSRILLAIIAAIAIILPFAQLIPGWTVGLATLVYLNALSVIGLNLIFGLTGMVVLGQAAFMVVPGYCAGLADSLGIPFYLTTPTPASISARPGA